MITFDDFAKIEIRIGKVLNAEKVEGSEKLLKLQVDFGSDPSANSGLQTRQILSGIAKWYAPSDIINKSFPFILNIEPRKIMGMESQGMIVAIDDGENAVLLLPEKEVKPGSVVR